MRLSRDCIKRGNREAGVRVQVSGVRVQVSAVRGVTGAIPEPTSGSVSPLEPRGGRIRLFGAEGVYGVDGGGAAGGNQGGEQAAG